MDFVRLVSEPRLIVHSDCGIRLGSATPAMQKEEVLATHVSHKVFMVDHIKHFVLLLDNEATESQCQW